jgi:hypothetical protein
MAVSLCISTRVFRIWHQLRVGLIGNGENAVSKTVPDVVAAWRLLRSISRHRLYRKNFCEKFKILTSKVPNLDPKFS